MVGQDLDLTHTHTQETHSRSCETLLNVVKGVCTQLITNYTTYSVNKYCLHAAQLMPSTEVLTVPCAVVLPHSLTDINLQLEAE